MKYISLLGSTGSIGRQTLDIATAHKDDLRIVAMAAGSRNLPLLAEQVIDFVPEIVAVPTAADATELHQLLGSSNKGTTLLWGDSGLEQVASHPQADTVVTGVVGFRGLKPTAAAIKMGKTVALANKETLVAAGVAVMPLVRHYGATIVPVDSEHSAIFQALGSHSIDQVNKLILTASGGPFRTWSTEQLDAATVDDALKHPNWNMGPKITVDSATLMNKGLEIIEARWLFDIPPSRIEVIIHPQSILHSAVEFVDGSIVGQLGVPDMRLPIHYALFYPERIWSDRVPRLNLKRLGTLSFEEPDYERFPCLRLAREIAAEENTLPCVLNAANEVAVEAFLKGHISFTAIAEHIERVIARHTPTSKPSMDDILEADRWARENAQTLVRAIAG